MAEFKIIIKDKVFEAFVFLESTFPVMKISIIVINLIQLKRSSNGELFDALIFYFRDGKISLCEGDTDCIVLFAVVFNDGIVAYEKQMFLILFQLRIWSFVVSCVYIERRVLIIQILAETFVLCLTLLGSTHLLREIQITN